MPRALLTALLAAALLAAGCGGGSDKAAKKPAAVQFEGAVATPPKPLPALDLKDSTGKPFDTSELRGKAALITFLYVHCPDVCPLITGNLHTAYGQLGAQAKNLRIVAVSTDPRGDRPPAVKKFLAAHQVTREMRYLIGSSSQLRKVWQQWGIISKRDKSDPEKVEHSALIYGVSASGKITTLYPSNFKPSQIVHDVPLLLKK